jgi:mono/diheme cytochrome c family protein
MHSGSWSFTAGSRLALVALAVGAAFATTAGAQPIGEWPQGKPANALAHGKQVFMAQGCYSCHGTEGQGGDRGTGPKLAPEVYPLEVFTNQLRHPRDLMPRYPKNFLSDADVADIHAYLSSVKPSPKAKDIPLLSGS